MSDQDYMVQGMQEAADKHDPAAMLAKYHRERDQVAPYIPTARITDQAPDTGALTPSQVRGLKVFAVATSILSACAGFLQACASGAMNTVFQYGAGAAFLAVVVSELVGIKPDGKKQYADKSGHQEHHHHYYQNNNFGGGGANQQNL